MTRAVDDGAHGRAPADAARGRARADAARGRARPVDGDLERNAWPHAERRTSPRRTSARPDDDRRDGKRPEHLPPLRPHAVTGESRREEWARSYLRLALVSDLVAAFVGTLLGYVFRFSIVDAPDRFEHLWGLLVGPALWIGAVTLSRAYEQRFFISSSEELRRVLQASVVTLAIVSTISYGFRLELARGFVLVAVPVVTVLALVGRLVAHTIIRRRRSTGEYLSRVLVVGHEWSVLDLVAELRREPAAGMQVVGACLAAGGGSTRMAEEKVPVLGRLSDIADVVDRGGIDVVAITTCVELSGANLRRLCWQLESTGVDIVVAPSLIEVTGPRLHIRPMPGLSLLHVEKPEFSGVRRIVKGALDRLLATAALVALSPVLLGIAVAVRLSSPGPVFFRQLRTGRGGKEFSMLKFRSMYVDAEQRRQALMQDNERGEGLLFKIRDDPRITSVGRYLRRYSLDELPQLVNIARGDMSLVGPRPPLPGEVALYAGGVERRLLVKPGLTGLWQVSGRSDLSWEDSVRLDLRYVENWSLIYDLHIIWRTMSAVVRGRGAY